MVNAKKISHNIRVFVVCCVCLLFISAAFAAVFWSLFAVRPLEVIINIDKAKSL